MSRDDWQTYLQSAPAPGAAKTGLAWLPELSAVRFAGSDARKFLQGYLTCDTADLADGRLIPTALCSLKGRVVMNGWCATAGDQDVTLVLHRSLTARLARFLKPYLTFSRTTLEDLGDDVLVLAGLDLPPAAGGLVMDERRRLFLAAGMEEARSLWESQPHMTAETWRAALVDDGIPLVSEAVSETFLPQMLNLEALGAVDFAKGCYLGQEVVARAQHRGEVKRHLTRLGWQGDTAPDPGSEVTDPASGRVVGVVVQSALTTPGKGNLLAVLQRDAADRLQQGDTGLVRLL